MLKSGSRRVVRVPISESYLVDWFFLHMKNLPKFVLVCPEATSLPEGSEIVGVHYDAHTNCFMAFIRHESFDEVPLGGLIPMWKEMVGWGYKAVNLREALNESDNPTVIESPNG